MPRVAGVVVLSYHATVAGVAKRFIFRKYFLKRCINKILKNEKSKIKNSKYDDKYFLPFIERQQPQHQPEEEQWQQQLLQLRRLGQRQYQLLLLRERQRQEGH